MSDDVAVSEREFLAEAEVMDLSPIRGETFAVSVSRGDPNGTQYLCTQLHGPYNFQEMCQEVGDMWVNHQHHAKVIVMNKDPKSAVKFLNENTVDYIEAHYVDIIVDEALAGFDDKQFTCTAGTVEEEPKPENTNAKTEN